MSLVVRFSRDLSSWLAENLEQGRAPGALVHTMVDQRMEAGVARAIVDAFLVARGAGAPLPTDSVTLEESALEYVYEGPIFKAGRRIETFDRTVQVVMRAQKPVLAVLAGLLDPDECTELIALARPRLEPSTIVDPKTGRDVTSASRTSFGMFFRLGETPLVAQLDRRVAEVMNLPVENGEGFQVLHYPEGAENAPHVDFLRPSNDANRASIVRSGQRVGTLIAYLNDVEGGGETVFPATGWMVSPERGNAVLFEYGNGLGQVDELTVHGGNRVLLGEKWVLTKWMRQRPFVSQGSVGSEGMVR